MSDPKMVARLLAEQQILTWFFLQRLRKEIATAQNSSLDIFKELVPPSILSTFGANR